VLEDRVPNTRFDQFFVAEFVKKIKSNEQLETIINNIKTFEKATILDDLKQLADSVNN